MTFLRNFVREESGQDLVEYTLLIVAAAFTGLALYQILGPSLKTEWNATSSAISGAHSAVNGS